MKLDKRLWISGLCVILIAALAAAVWPKMDQVEVYRSAEHLQREQRWTMGFGRQEIAMPENEEQPYYIAGYNNGWEPKDVLDLQCAQAVWMDAGGDGMLLIGVDCIALSSETVKEIRDRLKPLCRKTGCTAVNIYSTHDHASVDTLGLWGPVMIDGKNNEFMENLMDAAVSAATQAAENRCSGTLHYGSVETDRALLRDSRDPQVFDPDLHQLRFDAEEEGKPGIRMYIYGAHAEALRGDNRKISRDFPGEMCDLIEEKTGDHAMFMPGAIGGLIMTQELIWLSSANMRQTGEILAEYALSIEREDESVVEPEINYAVSSMTVPLDNTGFLFYKFLGILGNPAKPGKSATGYVMQSELTALQLGNLLFALIPGEIFPELVWEGEAAAHNPEGVNPPKLSEIAEAYGHDRLLVVGLVNDELGYIVPPSDFLLNEEIPYLSKTMDESGENHYEETNSVGPECAVVIAETFEKLLKALEG